MTAQRFARSVSILGATGSIGASTAAVIAEARATGQADIVVEAVTGGSNVGALVDQAAALGARFAAIADPALAGDLKDACAARGLSIETGAGPAALIEAGARPAEWVMSAIVGAAALDPTLAAVRRGVAVALANKECLVCAGDLVLAEASKSGARLLPVDSEHNAIFQCLQGQTRVETLTLTASGGPFRTWSLDRMAAATPDQACAHPKWSMGRKISVDSATLMNKGLELIEAGRLFGLPEHRIDVVVHPQSIIHSLVTFEDGSVLAQLSEPDMRVPIAYALAWPDRLGLSTRRLDLAALAQLTFERPDMERFPALALAREAFRMGGAAPAVLNAANEVAVDAFLNRQISFLDVAGVVSEALERAGGLDLISKSPSSFDEVAAIDAWGRAEARRAADRRRAA
ncbi:MAG: 1-deoxy-D-xylulose-5-phosphate reductoisomerase [Alphaproteobacteria bacterium]|nr:1-deoxy-D-xylulose-5-phosphate reductoisomerase [Alphaproteobacteria bacterium]